MKLPGTPISRTVYVIIVILIGIWFLIPNPLEKTQEPEPKPVQPISFKHAPKIEKAWINQAFPQQLDYLLAPVTPLPCPTTRLGIKPPKLRNQIQQAINAEKTGHYQDSKRILKSLIRTYPDRWFPVLTLSILSAKHHEESSVLPVLENYLNARWDNLLTLKSNDSKSAVIHLLYMYGLLRLKTGQYDHDKLLWRSLKFPLGRSILKSLGISGPSNKPIQKPGCSAHNGNELTTHALYSNLIVGYLKTKNFEATPYERKRECKRAYDDQPLDTNPLFPVLRKLCPSLGVEEYWIWVISNAELLLSNADEPSDSLLNFNLMLLIDEVIKRFAHPDDIQNALLQKRDHLRRLSISQWSLAPAEYKKVLALSLAKLATTAAVEQADNIIPADMDRDLTNEQAKVIKAIRFTVRIRNSDSIRKDWQNNALRNEIRQKLGTRANEWQNAMDKDLGILGWKIWNWDKDNWLVFWHIAWDWVIYLFYTLMPIIIIPFFSLWIVYRVVAWLTILHREYKAFFRSFYHADVRQYHLDNKVGH